MPSFVRRRHPRVLTGIKERLREWRSTRRAIAKSRLAPSVVRSKFLYLSLATTRQDRTDERGPPLPLAGEGRGEGRRAHQLRGESARVMFTKVFCVDARRMDDSRDWRSHLCHKAKVRARALRRATTDAERALWYRLRDRRLAGHKFRRQHPIGPYIADFACVEAGLVIELDGGQHFHRVHAAADARRTAAMNACGFHVMRFTDREALLQIDAVLTRILEPLTLTPTPLPHAGEGTLGPS